MERDPVKADLTEQDWSAFERDGCLRLGRVLDDAELAEISQRMDDIMLGEADVDYDRMMFQLDRDPDRDGRPGPETMGHKGATLAYRKIQQLEFDPIFLRFMQKALYRRICEQVYGEGRPIACFRAMFMNKPAGLGTELQWHQDRWTDLDRDPQITIWLALNDATVENGCMKIVPGSHCTLLNPEHGAGFLTPEMIDDLINEYDPEFLELKAGEAVLLHNWMLHSSEVNHTDVPRRAFSVCYMDGATRSSRGHAFSIIFGEGALEPEALGVVAAS